MIYANIDDTESYAPLLANPVWKDVFEYIKRLPSDPAIGITQIKGDGIYMNVMRYDTLPREDCKFETHRKYVDLQYTIEGSEIIEWRRNSELEKDGPYDDAKDLQFYQLSDSSARVHMPRGYFCIFYPTDAHLPRVADSVNSSVFKVVFKVSLELLGQTSSQISSLS